MATMQDIADKMGISKSTVSKALNGASDISEALQKQVLETAVEMGYTKTRRQKSTGKKVCVFIENMEYKEPHQFGYEILLGFRQMAEPAGYQVDIILPIRSSKKMRATTLLCFGKATRALLWSDFPFRIVDGRFSNQPYAHRSLR